MVELDWLEPHSDLRNGQLNCIFRSTCGQGVSEFRTDSDRLLYKSVDRTEHRLNQSMPHLGTTMSGSGATKSTVVVTPPIIKS